MKSAKSASKQRRKPKLRWALLTLYDKPSWKCWIEEPEWHVPNVACKVKKMMLACTLDVKGADAGGVTVVVAGARNVAAVTFLVFVWKGTDAGSIMRRAPKALQRVPYMSFIAVEWLVLFDMSRRQADITGNVSFKVKVVTYLRT